MAREKELLNKRNESLLRRYYHLTEKERLRFDDALKILSKQEFFISEERIMAIIREYGCSISGIVIAPVPKVRKPKINAKQLDLLIDKTG
jgi:hypothetical protein